jgi:hypothetical protein
MKGSIKEVLNIPGVQGYIVAGRNGVQVKLPSKFSIPDARERFTRLLNDLADDRNRPNSLIEIFTGSMAVVIFCSASPVLIVVTSNIANLPLIRIRGKLAHLNMVKEARG